MTCSVVSPLAYGNRLKLNPVAVLVAVALAALAHTTASVVAGQAMAPQRPGAPGHLVVGMRGHDQHASAPGRGPEPRMRGPEASVIVGSTLTIRGQDFTVCGVLEVNRSAFYVGCHPEMSDEDVQYVIDAFHAFFRERR